MRSIQSPIFTASLRKLRWGAKGRSKRGGAGRFTTGRWRMWCAVCCMLYAVRPCQERAGRSDAHSAPRAQARGAGGVEVKAEAFEELLAGVRQVGDPAGRAYSVADDRLQADGGKSTPRDARAILSGIRADDRHERGDAAQLGTRAAHAGRFYPRAVACGRAQSGRRRRSTAPAAPTRWGTTVRCCCRKSLNALRLDVSRRAHTHVKEQ